MSDSGKTGLFKAPDGHGIIVLWRGQQIAQYASMADFVAEHDKGLETLELQAERLLHDQYRDKL